MAGKNDGTITASYFDKDIGFSSSDSTAQTTVALQTPTGATGIYSTWDANIWDFGTSSEYPSLKPPAPAVDYDTDGDNLIEVSTLDQLNAIRWDLDGNGAPDAANANDYALAFPNAATGMGCPITAADADDNDCTGYELDADLDFNTDTGSDSGGAAVIDAADDYYNSGSGWEPLGDSGPNPFRTTFEGNNHTISNLFINVAGNSDNYIGLFGQLGGATVTRVHLVDAKVTGNNDVGALVGHITLGTVSHSSSSGTVSGVGKVGGLVGTIYSSSGVVEYSRSSAVVTATGDRAGGLIGENVGDLRASYATGAVTGASHAGGLVGDLSANIFASYATGGVATTGSDAVAGRVGGLAHRQYLRQLRHGRRLRHCHPGGRHRRGAGGLSDRLCDEQLLGRHHHRHRRRQRCRHRRGQDHPPSCSRPRRPTATRASTRTGTSTWTPTAMSTIRGTSGRRASTRR